MRITQAKRPVIWVGGLLTIVTIPSTRWNAFRCQLTMVTSVTTKAEHG